jgi:hypothetical protein
MTTPQPTSPSNHGTSTANAQATRSNLERARRFGRLFPDEECWTLGDPARDLEACNKIAAAMHAAGSQVSQKLPAGFTYLGQFIDHDIRPLSVNALSTWTNWSISERPHWTWTRSMAAAPLASHTSM